MSRRLGRTILTPAWSTVMALASASPLKTTNGSDGFFLNGTSSVGGNLKLNLGGAGNTLNLNAGTRVEGNLALKLGSGDDTLDVTGTTAGGQTRINLDGGTNSITP
jgi:hypothetical protein